MENYVFVYGTLMNGKRNHYILEDSKFIGNGFISDYFMFNIVTYPGIQKSKYKSKVYGEVYQVSEETLKQLDILEEVGTLYNKEIVRVYLNDFTIDAIVYVYILKEYIEENENEYYYY